MDTKPEICALMSLKDKETEATNSGERKTWTAFMNFLNGQKLGGSERLSGKCFTSYDKSLDCMTKVKEIDACPVRMPNGDVTYAVKVRTLSFGDQFKLRNVLYVPKLDCNLISIPQLLDDCVGSVLFTKKYCVIQDLNLMMSIGAGERSDGLNLLKGVGTSKFYSVVRRDTTKVWHKRLGHPSS
ncbi:hypothetical protein V2J09_020843 [Rumex salicifolius]